jgi:LysR family nitrogen assimilation transcriptional regulator
MELRRLRTFVAVAELGTVSKAALRLRITQPALSRQIMDLQQELELRLFDRVGRRLILTAEGEQFLGHCRGVLAHIDALGERAEVLRRGNTGVLKVAAPPHTIESVLSPFLPRYAERFPNVHVKLSEALGREQTAMLERGEVHIGIRHDQGDRRFESRVLPPDEVLAACALTSRSAMAALSISLGSRPIPCCYWTRVTQYGGCLTRLAVSRISSPTFCSRAARRIPC